MQDNDRTLQAYQTKTTEYISGTPPLNAEEKTWLDEALKLMPRPGKILELGSGFGRDAAYVQSQGHIVECSDAVDNFVQLLQEKGFAARHLNALKDSISPGYAMIFANGVLLHFTPEETTQVLHKIHGALIRHGIFAFRVKQGDGAAWSEEKLGVPRYFHYWQPEPLRKLITREGFEWVHMSTSHTGHNQATWLHIIARKLQN